MHVCDEAPALFLPFGIRLTNVNQPEHSLSLPLSLISKNHNIFFCVITGSFFVGSKITEHIGYRWNLRENCHGVRSRSPCLRAHGNSVISCLVRRLVQPKKSLQNDNNYKIEELEDRFSRRIHR